MRGTAKKRGSKWSAIFDEGRGEDGKRKQRWIGGFATKHAAESYITAQLSKMQRGEYTPPTKLTVAEHMRAWLAGRTKIRPSTRHGYAKNIDTHIIPRIGDVEVQQLTRSRIARFYGELVAERGLSARSVRHVHTVLRCALADLVPEALSRNPCDRVELPTVNAEAMRTWDAADVRAFLDHARDDRLYALWMLALATGARRGELCGLTWRSVDLEAGTVTITDTLLDVGGVLTDGKPKTARGGRVVPLDTRTIAALRAHKRHQAEERLAFGAGFNERGLVFVREDGSPVHPAWLTRRWRQIVKASGAPMIRLHDARHTSASMALAAGIPISVVSERLGHAKTSITLDVYAHVMPAQHREAADKLGNAMFGS